MSLTLPVLLIAASLASVLGGSMLYFRRQWSEQSLLMMISIGGGLLFALTTMDMLPHSMAEDHSFVPFVLFGFACVFVIESLSHSEEQMGITSVIGIMCGFLLHAFMEGISLKASFHVDAQVGMSVVVALILHKIPDGISLASILLMATGRRGIAFLGAVMLGVATLAGAWVMEIVEKFFTGDGVKIVFAMATGVFLYISASHLVPLIQRKGQRGVSFLFVASMVCYLVMTIFFRGNGHPHV